MKGATGASPASIDPTTGLVLEGRYRLVRRLGRGGFGDVWCAEELLPDGAAFRSVALKLLGQGQLDVSDWTEEAKLLASFRHPSLVTIYAAGLLNGTPFVAMELLEGQSLSEVARARGPVPWRRVMRWAESTASALDVIHRSGVVHLDLKPANLFLCSDGALKVLDFGIARRAGAAPVSFSGARLAAELSATVAMPIATLREGSARDLELAMTRRATHATDGAGRAVVGTPGFIAPEILSGRAPTPAADAYALAVCVAELVTGSLPHDAPAEPRSWDDASAVSQWLDNLRDAAMRGALRPLEPPFPSGIAALLKRLLAVDPDARDVRSGELAELFAHASRRPHGVPNPPYPGLRALGPEAEGVLFGRDDDVLRLGRELEFEPCIVVQGARGAGKTSLCRAGIAPYLGAHAVDGMDDFCLVEVAPGSDPDAALEAALAAVDPILTHASADDLEAYAAAHRVGVALFVDPLDAAAFALPDRRQRLEALVTDLVTATRPGVRLIATLGDERMTEVLATPLGAALRGAMRFVGAPTSAAARDLAIEPARLAGAEVHGAEIVAAEVERELRAGSGRLRIVSLALASFWNTRERLVPVDPTVSRPPRSDLPTPAPSNPVVEHHASGKVVIRSSSPSVSAINDAPMPSSRGPTAELWGSKFRDSGGVRGALVRHAEAALSAMQAEVRVVAERLLLLLSATDGSPRTWLEDDLVEAAGGDVARAGLERLDALAIVARGAGRVGVSHEALLSSWPRLSDLRLSRMEDLALGERLREAASTWQRADEHRDFLLRDALLADVAARASKDLAALGLTARERSFVRASVSAARRRRALRIAAMITGALALVGAVVFARALEVARRDEESAKKAAVELEYVSDLAAKSRRATDLYGHVAFAAEAIARGSNDPSLPVEMSVVAANAARADVLTLEKVTEPEFPWDDRFLVGESAGGELVLADFRPPGGDVIDDVDIDLDPEIAASAHAGHPRVTLLRPHAAPLAEVVPFAFDTAFVTRSVSGEVKVFRLRANGSAVLAAVAPMRCVGALRVAARAPVVACPSDAGIVRWDLRRPKIDVTKFPGSVEDVSPDGSRIAAKVTRRLVVWSPEGDAEISYHALTSISFARFSPDGRTVAVGSSRLDILDLTDPDPPIFSAPLGVEPVSARWDDRGLDLGVCSATGQASWIYLRRGGRAEGDTLPLGDPCKRAHRTGQPELLAKGEVPDELRARDVGGHFDVGGFRLPHRRFLSRDLTLFDAVSPTASTLLAFHGKDELGQDEEIEPGSGPHAIEREGGSLAAEVGDEVRVYSVGDSSRYFTRRGKIVRRCADGRLLAASTEDLGVRVFDVWTGRTEGFLPREPAFVVGADSSCRTLLTQRLDGDIVASALEPDGVSSPRTIARADGYVLRSKPARASKAFGPGLWLALSSGAIAHVEDGSFAVRVLGYASPRATALADGPAPGEVTFADTTGVAVFDPQGRERHLLAAVGDAVSDISPSPEGPSMLLASDNIVSVLDLTRHEIVGRVAFAHAGRFSAWDDEGSVLAWSAERAGGVEGEVIPRSRALARTAATLVSNLEVQGGRLLARR